MEVSETYKGRVLTALPRKTERGRWAVAVRIASGQISNVYFADDEISYILREEAEKECLNLGRNLVNRGEV